MNIDMWLLEHITLEPYCLSLNACGLVLIIREAKCGVSSSSKSAVTFPRLYGQYWSKWNTPKSWLHTKLEYSGIWIMQICLQMNCTWRWFLDRHPDDLYKGGLQRELFLPFIAKLKEKTEIHDMNSAIDYRKLAKHKKGLSFTPEESSNPDKELTEHFEEIAHSQGGQPEPRTIAVQMGRKLHIPLARKALIPPSSSSGAIEDEQLMIAETVRYNMDWQIADHICRVQWFIYIKIPSIRCFCMNFWFLVPSRPNCLHRNPTYILPHLSMLHCMC